MRPASLRARTSPLLSTAPDPAAGRSKVTAAAFTRAGYNDVRVYSGGKADWYAAGLPMERIAAAS